MNTGSLSGIFDEYNSKHKVYHNKHLESSHWGTLSSAICRLRLYEERGQLLNQTNKAVNSTPLIPHKSSHIMKRIKHDAVPKFSHVNCKWRDEHRMILEVVIYHVYHILKKYFSWTTLNNVILSSYFHGDWKILGHNGQRSNFFNHDKLYWWLLP